MALKLLGGGSDLPTVISDMNSNILELVGRQTTEIFKDETGLPRVILDSAGLRTSPAGVDVTTATVNQYTFNSSQNTFKVSEGPYLVTIPSGSTGAGLTNTFTGTLSFSNTYSSAPAVLPFLSTGGVIAGLWAGSNGGLGQGLLEPLAFTVGSGSNVVISQAALRQMSITATGATFGVRILNGSSGSLTSPSYLLKVYVLQETAI